MSDLGQQRDECREPGEAYLGINLAYGVIPRCVRVVSVLVVIMFCSAYLTAFGRAVLVARRGYPPRTLYLVLLFIVIALAIGVLFFIVWQWRRLLSQWLHQYRYAIGTAVVTVATVFSISGSSLAMWSTIIGGDGFQGTLWGIPRSIRSDEFVVFTPFAFSQAYTSYAPISDIIRAFPTDVTMLYAQPAWALATLFRPFLWGFMAFGSQHGLAFFWSARLVVLLLISYEFGRWLTDDRKSISVAYAIFIGFAPIVQWWFSVNGTAELLIFGQALVVLYYRYLNAKNARVACGHMELL